MNAQRKLIAAMSLCVAVAQPGLLFGALIDRGGGLIYDTDLNITWLQDANYAMTTGLDMDGNMDWQSALAWADSATYFDAVRGVTWSDWRLPRVSPIDGVTLQRDWAPDGTSEVGYNITSPSNELSHLFYVSLGNAADQNLAGITHNFDPFINLPTVWRWENGIGDWFWTQTEYPFCTSTCSYHFDTFSGQQNVSDHTNQHLVWLVRDGDVGASTVPIPAAAWLFASGLLGLIGIARKKAA